MVLSDWIKVRITSNPGETFIDRMIALVEGATRQKTPNEVALSILLSALTIVFLLATATVEMFAIYAGSAIPVTILVALLVTLIPTTIAGHRFWEEGDTAERDRQAIQLAKNAGLLGGLLAAALDTGGRPSVFWSGRRAAERAAHNVADTVSGVYHTLPVVS